MKSLANKYGVFTLAQAGKHNLQSEYSTIPDLWHCYLKMDISSTKFASACEQHEAQTYEYVRCEMHFMRRHTALSQC